MHLAVTGVTLVREISSSVREPRSEVARFGNIRSARRAKQKRRALRRAFFRLRWDEDYSSSGLPVRFLRAAPRMSPREAPESEEPYCATASFSSLISRALIESETLRVDLSI